MKLNGYDLLMDIRKAGFKPRTVCVCLFPVKRLPVFDDFVDTEFSTVDEYSELHDYDLTAFRGLNVCLIGNQKDDRLRNATKTLLKISNLFMVIGGNEIHERKNGVWL
jgi:hypothetical protein